MLDCDLGGGRCRRLECATCVQRRLTTVMGTCLACDHLLGAPSTVTGWYDPFIQTGTLNLNFQIPSALVNYIRTRFWDARNR